MTLTSKPPAPHGAVKVDPVALAEAAAAVKLREQHAQQTAKSGNGQAPTTTETPKEDIHPILAKLRKELGVQKVGKEGYATRNVMGFGWTLRPLERGDFEWAMPRALDTNEFNNARYQSVIVSLAIAAIDGVPVIELYRKFWRDTDFLVPDPYMPPQALRHLLAEHVLREIRAVDMSVGKDPVPLLFAEWAEAYGKEGTSPLAQRRSQEQSSTPETTPTSDSSDTYALGPEDSQPIPPSSPATEHS